MSLEQRSAELLASNSALEAALRDLQDKLFEANRQQTALSARYSQLERTKE